MVVVLITKPTLLSSIAPLATLVASVVAIWGIRAWRSEFTGKRQIELAQTALALFYEAQDMIRYIRNPMSWQSEGELREPASDETPGEKKARDQAYVLIQRYKHGHELFNKIHAMRYQFMAHFGREAAKPFDSLRSIENDLISASRRLARRWSQDPCSFGTPEAREVHAEQVEKYEALFWEDHTDPDPVNPRLDELILEIEDTCRGIMTRGK